MLVSWPLDGQVSATDISLPLVNDDNDDDDDDPRTVCMMA